MKSNRTIIYLLLIMAFVAAVISGVAIGILYNTAFEEKRKSLIQTVQSQARLIEAVARFDMEFSAENISGGAIEATLGQIREAHQNFKGFGRTGEYTLARREGEQIVFILRLRHGELDKPMPVPFSSGLAEPMRRALEGKSGSVVGLDYRGVEVLSAHEPVAVLNLGIVAKIDIEEVRAPFIQAGLYVAIIAVLLICLATVLFFRISNPMVRRIEESEERLQRAILNAPIPIMLHTEPGEVMMISKKWTEITGYTHEEIPTIDEWAKKAYGGEPPVIAEALKQAYSVDIDTVDEGTFVVTIASGEKRIWTFSSSLLGSTTKGDILLITTVQDMTERKRMDEELHESRMHLEKRVEERTQELTLEIKERKQAEKKLKKSTDLSMLLYQTIMAINEARSVDETIKLTLASVCNYTGWPAGHAYITEVFPEPELHPSNTWYLKDQTMFEEFRKMTPEITFKTGIGLPGQVLESGKPAWILDVTKDEKFLRRKKGMDMGVRSAFAFPVLAGTDMEAVLEFFSDKTVPPDIELLQTLEQVGIQIGRSLERQRARKKLRDSEAKYRQLLDTIPQKVFYKDLDSKYIIANPSFASDFNLKPEDITGKTDFDLYPKKMAEKFQTDDRLVFETGAPINVDELTLIHGEEKYVNTLKTPVHDKKGNIIGLLAIFSDITDRKRAEEAIYEREELFRAAFENISIGNIIISDKGVIETLNHTAVEIFGYQTEELIGQNVSILMPEPYSSQHDEYIQRYHKSGVTKIIGTRCEVVGRRKNGEEFPIHIGIGTIDIGGRTSFIGSISDLTSTKLLEKKLVQSEKMQVIGQLIGGIAHDFNNLLAIIMLNLELMEDDIDNDPGLIEKLNRALDAVDIGSDLTDHLLAYSRQQVLHSKVASAIGLINNVVQMLGRTLGEDITINVEFDVKDRLIDVDASVFETAILNLAVNARDAMPEGGDLTIKMSSVELDEAFLANQGVSISGAFTMISVADTGDGMGPMVLESAFEPFYTTKPLGAGTGLGLSMVYGTMKQFNGFVTIDSELGKGTSINLYFPEVDGFVQQDEVEKIDEVFDGTGKTVLLVEDDRELRISSGMVLRKMGFIVLKAEDSLSALEIMKSDNQKIDLVFSDVVMSGGLSGIELVEEIFYRYGSVRVLLTTGYPDRVIANDSVVKKGIHILTKPYRSSDLKAAIYNLMIN